MSDLIVVMEGGPLVGPAPEVETDAENFRFRIRNQDGSWGGWIILPAGPPGSTAVIQIGTVETLPSGSPAEVSITGSAPDFTLNFKLPMGPEGPPGPPVSGNSVTNAHLADVPTATLKGRIGAGPGDPMDLTKDQLRDNFFPTGSTIASSESTYSLNADLSLLIPVDDTVPLQSEGTQICNVTVTPKSTANKVELSFTGMGSMSAVGGLTIAIFRDSTCIAAKTITIRNTGDVYPLDLGPFEDAPATTAAVVYSARVGPNTGVARLNGSPVARAFGGAAKCVFRAKEIKG